MNVNVVLHDTSSKYVLEKGACEEVPKIPFSHPLFCSLSVLSLLNRQLSSNMPLKHTLIKCRVETTNVIVFVQIHNLHQLRYPPAKYELSCQHGICD